MSHFKSTSIVIGSLITLLLIPAFLAHGAPDDPAFAIKLLGIPAPYSFQRVCKLRSGDLWIAEGDGGVQHISSNGASTKVHVANADLNGVFFTNAESGWVVGEHGTIAHTEDSGVSWNNQASGVTKSLEAVTCWNDNLCWAVGEDGIVLSTNDRGNHWTKKKTMDSVRLFAVSFVSNEAGWAVGEGGSVIHTTDGGKSWEKQQATVILFPDGPFAKPTDLLTVKFVNANDGWVGGAGGVATTSDGGKTWKATEIEGAAFVGLVSHDGNTVWAISRGGSNYRTRDRGLTWEPVNSDRISAKRIHRS